MPLLSSDIILMDSPILADEVDYLVPSLRKSSWGNPVIHDSFIGVTDLTLNKLPLGVEFVEANSNNNRIRTSSSSSINYSNVSPLHFGYDSSSREDLFSLSAPAFQYQVGGAIPARVPSWFEQDADIGSLINWEDSADSLELWEVAPTVNNQPRIDKDEILQEIVRECAEIEQRQSSPTIDTYSSRDSSTSPSSSVTSLVPKKIAGGKIRKVARGDRAERKKAQNRMAATRYRQKKRAENEQVGNEMHQLATHNSNLKMQIEDLSYEIDYLKNLMVEIGLKTTS